MPEFIKVDHIHIYVPNPLEAERWYKSVLDFKRVEKFEFWFTEGGPLTIENGDVHIALFENNNLKSTTTAFSVDASNYVLWKKRLKEEGVNYRESDHTLSWSIYFSDPYENPFEITCYDYQGVSNPGNK